MDAERGSPKRGFIPQLKVPECDEATLGAEDNAANPERVASARPAEPESLQDSEFF